jgi:hypothetical protein
MLRADASGPRHRRPSDPGPWGGAGGVSGPTELRDLGVVAWAKARRGHMGAVTSSAGERRGSMQGRGGLLAGRHRPPRPWSGTAAGFPTTIRPKRPTSGILEGAVKGPLRIGGAGLIRKLECSQESPPTRRGPSVPLPSTTASVSPAGSRTETAGHAMPQPERALRSRAAAIVSARSREGRAAGRDAHAPKCVWGHP